jgi:hypothetical protein
MPKKDASTRSTIETITPLSALTPKSTGADTDNFKRHDRKIILLLIVSLVLLVTGGGWLLHYLSNNPLQADNATKNRPAAPAKVEKSSTGPAPAQPPPAADPVQLAKEKENAEQRLADYLAAKDHLVNKGVAEWGGPLYAEMIKFGQAADSFYMKKEYNAASEHYVQATTIAEDLAGRSADALIRLLDEGQTALEAGDGSLAQRKFAAALMIDSANPVARRGLQRAKTIETVIALIASGKQQEASGDLSLAAADYQKALQLDAYSQEARKALESVNGRIREAQFQQLISEGLAAFHQNQYPLARKKLIRAKSLKPESREVLDALSQVDQAMRLARIDALHRQAQAAESTEDWQSALKSYQAVLDIDKNLQFANRGKKRAAEQIRIAKRLDFFLAKPDTLESDSQLKNAILLLSEASDVEPQGPKLADRIKKLDRLVSIAKTPVKITIESDNLTQVAVYRVGKLGRFEVRELELRPGTYTVVGARDGYQDIRQKIVVKPNRQPIRITVKCKVKI